MVEGEGEILMESKLEVFKKAYLIQVQSIYDAVLISAVQQRESFIDVYAFFFIFFSTDGLSQDPEYHSSLATWEPSCGSSCMG